MQPEQTDTLFQNYGRDLYKIGTEDDPTTQMIASLNSSQNVDNSSALEVSADSLGSGVDTSSTDQGVGYLAGGKTQFDNTQTGYILGIDKGVAKFYLGNATNYIDFDGTSTTIVGGLNVSSLNIPDTTTASSMHVDTSGNTWWAANVATGYTGANAYVLATGAAVFKSIQVGGTSKQYSIGNSGIFSFGDGSDGAGVADGSGALAGASLLAGVYTLTRDVYYTSLTVSTGVTIIPAGYRIFCTGTMMLNGTATIARNGNPGIAGSGTSAGAAGGALADGYLKGSLAGKAGGVGGAGGVAGTAGTAGTNGSNTSNSIGSNGVAGGAGGQVGDKTGSQTPPGGGSAAGGSATTGGTATASNVKLIANWHLATLLDIASTGSTVKFDNSASSGGGSGGGGGDSTNGGFPGGNGGGGGGSGSGGGIVAIYAKDIVVGASASMVAYGGSGGAGASGSGAGVGPDDVFAGGGGGGGGGAGGDGGQVILVYNTLTNSGTIAVTGGTGGTGGAGGTPWFRNQGDGFKGKTGVAGSNGTNGTDGTIRQFQLSL